MDDPARLRAFLAETLASRRRPYDLESMPAYIA
jgi:hypothetical protein